MENTVSRAEIAKHSGITWKDILFYALGDFGICLVFASANVLLNKYYTSCLMFNPIYIIVIFVIARLWDAINDPIMGRIADKMKPNKHGKFKRWFLYMCLPFAVSAVLMFCQFGPVSVVNNLCNAPWQYVLACFTYILFGMSMTAIQIPYGSLASVVTLDTKERSKLSIARGIAGNLGGLPVLIVKAMSFKTNAKGGSYVDPKPLIIGVAILAVFSVVFMYLCYKFTKERSIPEPAPKEKGAFKKAMSRIAKNRAMLSICIISVIVAGGGMFKSVITPFISADFFGYSGVMTILPEIFDGLGIAITMFLVPAVSKRLGKKESSAMGLYFSTVINVAIMFLFFMLKFNKDTGKTLNATAPYILFVVGNFLSGLGAGFFSCLLWGMVADSVDDIQIKTGIREDGTSYSILMFFRKIGQTFSFVVGQAILIAIGFAGGQALNLGQKTTLWFVAMSVLIACYGIGALLFTFWFPIDKNKLEEIQDAKELMLKKKAEAEKATEQTAVAK